MPLLLHRGQRAAETQHGVFARELLLDATRARCGKRGQNQVGATSSDGQVNQDSAECETLRGTNARSCEAWWSTRFQPPKLEHGDAASRPKQNALVLTRSDAIQCGHNSCPLPACENQLSFSLLR